MYIQDIEGTTIVINDVTGTIRMIRAFLNFEQKHSEPSLQRLEQRRIEYWEDILQKLLALDSDDEHTKY